MKLSQMQSRAARLGVSAGVANDTVWVGYSSALSGSQLANNYWSVGAVGGVVGTVNGPVQPGTAAGKRRPGPNTGGVQNGTNGLWTWENPVHGDSLQGWWPVRQYQQRAGGTTQYNPDYNRPWWAAQFGNIANYVINERRDGSGTSPGDRTFGVIGVWHSDPGNVVTDSTAGCNVHAPAWTVISGTKSAWMGQRGHGDLTVKDPITKNPFNADCTDFLGTDQSNNAFTNESSKHFPGYGAVQDQMLYRDISVDGTSNGVDLRFTFKTAMSTGKGTSTTTRTGWFEGDPLSPTAGGIGVAAGNFISAEAGTPANAEAPIDSFQVYVGEPIGNGSSADSSPGASWTDSNSNSHASVYDYARRWFNEVLKKGNRLWLAGYFGNNSQQTVTLSITGAQKNALKGATGRLRYVFRVHTNLGFDDENTLISNSTSYNSAYQGAVQLDDVKVCTDGSGTNFTTIGDFEGSPAANDINNAGNVTALNAWKSTGKPPAMYFHVHDLSDLASRWVDLCGGPNSASNICNMFGQVISVGDHDNGEANTGTPGTTEQNHYHGMFSPSINFVGNGTGNLTPNSWNLTTDMAEATSDYYQEYELYTGIFNLTSTGQLWQFGFEWYPVRQADGAKCWTGLKRPGFRYFNPDPQCFTTIDAAKVNGAFVTSNASGVPDSARVFQSKLSECFRFGIPDAACGGGTDLALFDNIGLMMVDGDPQTIGVDIWQFYVDTFPMNESVNPATADLDTCGAQVRAGLNVATTTGSTTRLDVEADSCVINADGFGANIRLDMVFRIKPGPGNYVTLGDVTSGLRKVPSSAVAYVAGDNSFWDVYTTDPGDKASPGAASLHAAAPSKWNPLVWNSARCDTTRAGSFFPTLGDNIDPSGGGQSSVWTASYHESEIGYDGVPPSPNSHPKRVAYANNNRRLLCFVKDTTISNINVANRICGATPDWIRKKPANVTGWTGDSLTTQGINILPDGMFTPGTHVEYFFRREDLTGPRLGIVDVCPDTNFVYPQVTESNFDGHRWQEFSVLPDRWKRYTGPGDACALYIDWNDRRGDEIIWTSVADSIGATAAANRGQNNGWDAPGGAGVFGEVNNPAYFVNKNQSAGTTWDKYDVKCAESTSNGGNSIGARLSTAPSGTDFITAAQTQKQAPTPSMLNLYKVIVLLSGDLNSSILGPFTDRSADDCKILRDWLTASTKVARHGILCGGNGFVQDASLSGPPQQTFINNWLGVDLDPVSGEIGYRAGSGNPATQADLVPQVAEFVGGNPTQKYGIRNTCLGTLDVLQVVNGTTTLNATSAADYQNVGANGPYHAAVMNKGDDSHPWYALTEGWDIFNVTSRFDNNTTGRLQWYYNAFANVFGSICAVQGTPIITLDTPNTGTGGQYVDFVGNFSNNPLRTGSAVVKFGLAQSDRVEVDIYDVAGRLQRKLADRMFPAGEHTLTWDGVNDQGHIVPRGVYFTQIKYVNRHFSDSKKLTVLK
ncbi:MAG TPA: FlgD immunoglobulin-like domain containing protein [Candidatus Udaeobacter sp.]|nr:FlgD immunoglobulin-like domain containing protein [Candidatus Udaeobacter sp.]